MKLYKTTLIFAYYSFKDPIFQSAVLPYFIGLNKMQPKLRFVLLTFEQKQFKLNNSEVAQIRKELAIQNIFWYNTNWHSGKFKIAKKIYDILQTLFISSYIILKYKVNIIYSEGFPGAVMGHWLSKIFHKKHIVHTFEPHTQYMIEAGVWNKDSWEAKWLAKYEHIVAKGADVILTATNAMIKKLKVKAQIHRVPSCVDTNLFNYSEEKRISLRKQLGIKENEVVITYLGKFGGMYMESEFFDFLNVCESSQEINFKYFIFTNDPDINDKIVKSGINKKKFLVKYLKREEISAYLSASDFGFVGVRQHPSKRYCSPIKDGEYWACGLPIIIPKGISDDYIFAEKEKIGIIMKDCSITSYIEVCNQVNNWKYIDKRTTVERCRKFVLEDRDVDTFKKKYMNIFMKINNIK